MTFDFRFKQFGINHQKSTIKVGTDAILLGALTETKNAKSILDIGTGCGVIALMLAQKSLAIITAIDIDKESIDEATDNFEKSPWQSRLNAFNYNLADFANNCNTKFDLIVTNPPYFSEKTKSHSVQRNLARNNESLEFSDLCKSVKKLLAENGSFWLILPENSYKSFCMDATYSVLFCIKKINIKKNPKSNELLIVSQWKHIPEKSSSINFCIYKDIANYSAYYLDITKEYLLFK